MLKLENVAAEEVTAYVHNEALTNLVYNSNIRSVTDLLLAVDDNPILLDKEFQKRLQEVIKHVGMYNKTHDDDSEIDTFNIISYQDPTLVEYDRENDMKSLLIVEPGCSNMFDYISLTGLSIDKLKQFLTLTTMDGENYLESTYFGGKSELTPRLVSAINLYTEMMDKLNKKYNTRYDRTNPICKHLEIRKQLVAKSYADIVSYLINNSSTSTYRWGITGELTLLKPIVSNQEVDQLTYRMLVEYLAKYLTIDELEKINEEDKQRVLDRFIVR